MDQDQFGGRTDDDLFSDDIEPVEEEETFDLPEAAPVPTHDPPAQPEPTPAPAPKSPKPPPSVSSDAPSTQETTTTAAPANAPTAPSGKQPPTGPRETSASSTTTTTNSSTAGTPQPGNNNGGGGGNTASAVSHARLSSGANPRTKLTDTELAARMERMRVVAAEKTRRFEEAQRDESEHAVAYARGMEEARRRRAEDAARRKAADEERRKLDDERARNRERKLKAMEMKEGGWDEGKAEREAEGGKRGFKGAHGGVRGARSGAPGGGGSGGGGGGLGGSRFANPNPGPVDEAGEFDGFGIRGRGGGFRGRGGRGRGGRGGGRALFDEREGEHNRDQGRQGGPAASAPPPPKKADLKKEDFPALPSSAAAPKKVDTAWVPKPGATDYPVTSPLGKWDEEVAATLDANQTPS
ncbi:uncharacterized protein B0H64DRAFT_436072 [Chaetomium fimeti]|uniref:Uncharacterized protein n=1 Tax=Chaetomium fimeti TaxID=1854472 RepID=A0AAE0H774_9PEZI|nr:hypothetical protein B0H64DRAFT_436072 [Chaetomium fimeti]